MTKMQKRNAKVQKDKPLDISLPRDLTSEIFEELDFLLNDVSEWFSEADWWGTSCPAKSAILGKIGLLQRSYKSKFVKLEAGTAQARKAAAIEKWLCAEAQNVKTNGRLVNVNPTFRKGGSMETYDFAKVIQLARRFIRETIGDTFPEDILQRGMFTNGASTRLKRDVRNVAKKYLGRPHASSDAATLISVLMRDYPHWNEANPDFSNPVIVNHSMMFTVPKNSEIDRVCCKEPEVNMFMQRACGIYIRSRLRKKGIDLLDQTPNQALAKRGSFDGSLATLDLSSASDTVSRELVRKLLPDDWYMILDYLRVRETLLPDGTVHELNMFSSMGNGFTFELETLVFWSIARAVATLTSTPGRIIVYGDDIIVPSTMAVPLKNVLSFCGFRTNDSKSFWSGPYRESCGKHFYDGMDVTPFFVRRPITTYVELIHYLNSFRKWATHTDLGLQYYRYLGFLNHWRKFSRLVPSHLKGGRDLDDVCSLVSSDRPQKRVIPLFERGKNVQKGGLLWWLHRSCEDSEFFTPSTVSDTESSRYGLRRNRTWERTLPVDMMFDWRSGE